MQKFYVKNMKERKKIKSIQKIKNRDQTYKKSHISRHIRSFENC